MQKILLVEDNPKDALLFSAILEEENARNKYSVTHVITAEKAAEIDIEREYDVIFLDMNLPGASGFDAIEKIQSRSANVPIVVLTANNDEIMATQAIKKGCQDYLVKGCHDADAIKRAIRHAIDRKDFENKIIELAQYDSLTGVVKRDIFYDRIEKAISLAKRNGIKLAVLFIDIDNFKHINDAHGHLAGDYTLKETAKRLKKCTRTHDTVARFGGDEFVVLLEGIKEEAEDCNIVAARIIKCINEPIQYENSVINISGSMGIAIYPECSDNSSGLVTSADAALQYAKQEGKNKYHFYTESLNQQIIRSSNLEVALRKAIENEELEAYFHPVIDIMNNRVESAEALARWNCKKFGAVSPMEFIPLAEKTGLISELSELILKNACRGYHSVKDIVQEPFKISLNISAKQFEKKDFAERFIKILKYYNMSSENISFEITESVFMDNNGKVADALAKFKDAGISLHLDDFGTGYSSLAYLSKLPVDTLKIDRSFVTDIIKNNNSQVISKAIMGIAQSLNLDVISEGVENKKQLDFLYDIGCYKIQGYYFAKPMPIDKFSEWILSNYKRLIFNRHRIKAAP